MTNKHLSLCAMALFCWAGIAPAFGSPSNRMANHCFPSIKDYVRSRFHALPVAPDCSDDDLKAENCGTGDSVDVNLRVYPGAHGLDSSWIWVVDQTPPSNRTRMLLHRLDTNEYCLVLTTSADEIKIATRSRDGSPTRILSDTYPSQGFDSWRKEFTFDSRSGQFLNTKCWGLTSDRKGRIKATNPIACSTIPVSDD